jgi:hypothetical protein
MLAVEAVKLEELLDRRVRIWLDGTRGKGRTVEGVVKAWLGTEYLYAIEAEDGRLPYAVDEARVLDIQVEHLWGLDGDEIRLEWEPVFNGRRTGGHPAVKPPGPPRAPKPRPKTSCGRCGKKGHDRRACPLPSEE